MNSVQNSLTVATDHQKADNLTAQRSTNINHASTTQIKEWAPLLVASGGNSNGNPPTNDILSASRRGIIIKVQNACELSIEALGQITRLSDEQVAQHPSLLNRLEPEAIVKEDTVFAVAVRGIELVAAVYARRKFNNTHRILQIGNLISDGSEQGIAVPMVAALILGDKHWFQAPANAEAIARILPNGDVNIGSTKTMMRLGFYSAKFFTHPLTTRNPQKAMRGSIEGHNADLKYLMQIGDASEILKRSVESLRTWNVRFGAQKTTKGCCGGSPTALL